ncbi:hypothetical protein DWG18_14125 [Lysobacter sp. TY2-98]|uniref:VOC family protein n=1 Tax=Lysobacter sp. TY2-98 TaxID=2290922 RepID=UPI000E1FF66F|nr:hypothetical protein [Lysobacter sp. TY2-98]AXK73302.1 hypothetical protein DWG18_14125 [Lysobacter sp. TY2-98]
MAPIGFIAFIVDVFGAVERVRHRAHERGIRHAEVVIGKSVAMIGERDDVAMQGAVHVDVRDVDACHARAVSLGTRRGLPSGTAVPCPRPVEHRGVPGHLPENRGLSGLDRSSPSVG